MVHEGIYATSAECIFKMGKGYDSVNVNEARINELNLQIESFINDLARRVFAVDTTAFTALPTSTKKLLTETASNLASIYAVTYDMSGFTSRVEAEDMINIFRDAALRGLSILRDKKTQDFLTEGGGN